MYFLELLVSGIAVGSLYALIAMGFVLIYKGTGVINFAQGEVIMVAAFIAYYLTKGFGIPFLLAVPITLVATALLGAITERLVIRPMLGEPVFSVVMITIGLSIFLRSMAGIVFGHHNYILPNPFPVEPVHIAGITLSHNHIWSMGVAFCLMVVFFLFFQYSRLGLGMRATANDQDTATLMGVNIKRVYALTWGISFLVAGVAGIFLANVMVLNVGLAFVAISAFPAVILGGLESVPGAIIGGLAIGVIENLAGGYLDQMVGGGIKDVTPFAVLFLVLMIKPYGLFGTKEVERV
ncbi:MAG: branched-chain amino acid ABC transporter permease [Proteobacteria bacterium]|nr:branched-chain amino acid ABC transporter permease [Pseudomonadota bacterium]MBU1451623.1 branched-chain amino acid ABC transporter permease [Pseudomonadota bacterium]MBU2469286.1 branched-chain amino acid ABC transporter permease [Pseudomonadota bacterium]MBU2517996.1 branched-chain amino acid ABC transporter permease [Pseudomonadota bacterium]